MPPLLAHIFNIQRFSIQDGPGIRTTVFFKGCPLTCTWCSNPESHVSNPELLYRRQNCQACFNCIEQCKQKAVAADDGGVSIDRSICNNCFECVEVCCSGALEITGMTMELDEVYDEVCKDALFYKNSKGGVTLSGGEPLNQIEFVEQLLRRLKQENIDTTVDTCGHAHWKKFEAILPYTDRFLFDLKQLNPLLHARETGIDNALILENLDKLLTREDTSVWLRIPVIGGFNDSEQHAGQISGFLNGKKVEKISLLPYHQWGIPKYKALGKVYRWSDRQTCNGKQLIVFKQIIEQGGFNVTIGF